ncbi:DUF3137 domain-containing protein [Mariniplasma anaerobium]|uniref:DUF3137 domain-containing protein n=1 Tax=Mariniplasma anaerobium TaxID=2735436 RepID=A0A7U9TH86_9MOLU|nr:DUF3137 domain-containing protein [Mariniplasma anaerobium]BCR36338.1 hypothetical protein MPAN_012310 [Mariniplasma anaerobium]
MTENLKTLEQKRLELLKARSKDIKIGLLILLGAVLFAILGFVTEVMFLLIIGVVIFMVSIIFLGKSAMHSKVFKDFVKSDLVPTLLEESFEEVSYDPKSHISIDRINGTGLIKRPDRYQGEDLIKGSYKGVKFEVSDINLKERVETRDSKGNVQVSYQTYFKGRWYIYRYQKQFDEVLKIVEGRGGYANKKGLEKFETESMAFNKKFAIYASSKEFGFYLITSSMLEKLLELEALHRGSIVYCYQNNELHIGVNDSKDYMEFKLKTPINEKTLEIFMSDIDLIPSIINEFRLDSSKFK